MYEYFYHGAKGKIMTNLLDPSILFFIFGIFAGLVRSNLEIPQQISRFLSLYLLMALGLKGGFALNKSGFTPEICEFTDKTLRIINKSVCNSCWEWDHFDKNNWHWCPAHAGTKRQFECTKTITAIDVINKIQTWTK